MENKADNDIELASMYFMNALSFSPGNIDIISDYVSIRVTRESINADGEVIQGSKKVIDVLSKPYANLSLQNQALIDEGVIDAISRQHYGYLPDDLLSPEEILNDVNKNGVKAKIHYQDRQLMIRGNIDNFTKKGNA